MKRSKLVIAAIAVTIAIVAVIGLSACVEVDSQLTEAFKLAANRDYLKVEVSDSQGVFYVYDNGTVTDLYNLGVKFEDVVGTKGEPFVLTVDNLKEGYICEKDPESGKVAISGELVNTGELGLDGAKLVLNVNTVEKTVNTYTVSYTDSNGYKVKITLS